MNIFLTGSTGYIGAHVAYNLLSSNPEHRLNLLVRAKDLGEARDRIWQAWQLHDEFPLIREWLGTRVQIFTGDLTSSQFGLSAESYTKLIRTSDSIIHCAASLNRRSEKSCLKVNLRGTLEMTQLGMRIREDHGLQCFSHVSTVAVAGVRHNEVVVEDRSVDWERSDYDPYARTKKFCEHMIQELLRGVPVNIFRPSIVLGDSRYGKTTQFDMVQAFVFLAGLPVLPFRSTDQIDIVNVDYVAEAIARIHTQIEPGPGVRIFHLSSGKSSQTYRELTKALAEKQGKRTPIFLPCLEKPFTSLVNFLANRRSLPGSRLASLMKVFMPYLVWNTVFDNRRVVETIGYAPKPFTDYCYPLLKFSLENHFRYPYRSWPEQQGNKTI